MTVADFANWVSETWLSIALTDSEWAFPAIESLHVIALTLVVGSIGVIDLRLLGVASKSRDTAELIGAILPVTWAAFVVAAITGALLFCANPISYSENFYFLGKLCLLVAAAANMAVFHLVVQKQLSDPRAIGPKISGGVSLGIWIAIVAFGRWIGFTL